MYNNYNVDELQKKALEFLKIYKQTTNMLSLEELFAHYYILTEVHLQSFGNEIIHYRKEIKTLLDCDNSIKQEFIEEKRISNEYLKHIKESEMEIYNTYQELLTSYNALKAENRFLREAIKKINIKLGI